MYDSDNFDQSLHSAIDNEVITNRPEEDRKVGEIAALVTNARESGQLLKRLKDLPDQPVGCINTFISNVIPKVIQILFRTSAQNVPVQARFFRRSSDFRRRRDRAVEG